MKFAQRTPLERTAIDAWIRVCLMVREDACLKVPDDFKELRREDISGGAGDIAKMLHYYSIYQHGGQSVSYTEYFQVSHPEVYGEMVAQEKGRK